MSPGSQSRTQANLDSWKKEIVFPFRIQVFCGTFPWSCTVLPCPSKGQRASGPWSLSPREKISSGAIGPEGKVPTGHSSGSKVSEEGPLRSLQGLVGKC